MLTVRHRTALVLTLTAALLIPASASSAVEVPPGCWLARDSVDHRQMVVTCPKTVDATPGTSDSTPARQLSQEELDHIRELEDQCRVVEERAAENPPTNPEAAANLARQRERCNPTAAAPGDAATAAQQVVAGMNLPAPTIGIAPRPTTVDPNSVGLVGAPNYMWVDNPEIFSTITDTATLGGWTITVVAAVEYVDWDMGDGQVIRCTGPGTPYEARFDLNPSPDCGHVYSVQGYYTVTATAHWRVGWTATDQTGTLTADQTASVPIVIGEAFAVRRV